MPGKSLQEKWGKVGSYIDGFFYDNDSLNAADLAYQVYTKYRQHTAHLSTPNVHLTGVACVMLEQVLYWACRFQPAFLPLVNCLREELYAAIYLQPPTAHRISVDDVPSLDTNTVEVEVERFLTESYFDVYRKYKVVAEETGDKAAQQSAELTALSNETAYWQDAYKRKIFTGWRVHVNASRRMKTHEEEVKKEVAGKMKSLEEENKRNADLPALVEELRTSLKQANDKVWELQKQNDNTGHQAEFFQHEMARLQQYNLEIPKLREKLTEAQEEIDKLTMKNNEIGKLLFNTYTEMNIEPQHTERLNNATFTLSDSTGPDVLLQWVNHMLQGQMCLKDFKGGFNLLDPLLILVRELSPFHFAEEELSKALKCASPPAKVDTLWNVLQTMKLPVLPIRKDDLLKDRTPPQFLSLIAILYLRFCDPTASREFHPNIRGLDDLTTDVYFFGLSQKSLNENLPEYLESQSWNIQQWKDRHKAAHQQLKYERLYRSAGVTAVSSQLHKTALMIAERQQAEDMEQEDTKKFTTNVTPALLRVALDAAGLPLDNVEEIVHDLRGVIKLHFTELSGIFRYYATAGASAKTGANAMGLTEFWRFCCDTGIVGGKKKGLTREKVRDFFRLANTAAHRDPDASFDADDENMDGTADDMSPAEWMEALVHMTSPVYTGPKYNEWTFVQKFESLVANEIVLKATKCRTDTFKRAIYDDRPVVLTLKSYNKYLMDIYNYYKKQDLSSRTPNPSGSNPMNDLNLDEYLQMLDDASMFDQNFNRSQAKDIFVKIQEDLNMMFHEFAESCVAVAAFKNPSPFLALDQKIKQFMDIFFLPRLAHKFKHWPKEIKKGAD
eukprot:TRINITY_DN3266_c0_g1_i1.p1 TRINITY_DN3266_c0_g1~~TRINITY_DN3266_c0_g1_i1.p1  ORF type:complete len:901 (-),score=83.88 TRINITY_DN3266_c0_g1_i1:104-2623(-)